MHGNWWVGGCVQGWIQSTDLYPPGSTALGGTAGDKAATCAPRGKGRAKNEHVLSTDHVPAQGWLPLPSPPLSPLPALLTFYA